MLFRSRIPHYGAIVSVELEKAQSAAGKPYGRAKFNCVRRLSEEEQARAYELGEMVQSFIRKPAAK